MDMTLTIKDGLEFEQDGDFAKAVKHYRRMLQTVDTDGERAEINLALARVLREDGEPDESQEVLGEAQRQAKAADDRRLQGLIAIEEGALAEDRGSLRYAANQYELAAELLAGTAEAVGVRIKLTSVERRRGEYTKSLETLRSLLEESLEREVRADALDELGAVLIARGEYDEAVDVLVEAVKLDSVTDRDFAVSRSRLLLAEAYLCRGDRKWAKRLLSEVKVVYDDADSKRGMSEYHLLQGRYYEDENKLDDAAREYRAGLRLDSETDDEMGQIRARLRLAAVKRRLGDLAEAEEHLEDAASLLSGKDEDGVESIALLTETGLLALRQTDFDLARRSFDHVLSRAKEDGDERAIALATRHLATAYREQGQLGKAESLTLEALDALERRNDQKAVADVLDDLGELLIEQGRWREAIAHLERGLSIDDRVGADGSRAWSKLLLGRAHLQLGQRRKAGSYLNDALSEYEDAEDESGQAIALYELGTYHCYEGKYRTANRDFKKAVEIQHRQSDRVGLVRTYRELSASYRKLGDLERAQEYLQDAKTQLGQATDNTERALLNAERARLALVMGELDDAAQLAQKARDALCSYGLEVEAAMCLRLLSQVEAARRNYPRALALLEEAREVFVSRDDSPELDDLYDDLAQVNLAVDDLDGAVSALEHSMRLGEDMGWFHGQGRSELLLGDVDMKRKDVDAARPHYQAALAAYEAAGDEVGRSEAHQRLGDWCREAGQYDDAIQHYKEARKLDQLHRDLHGLAQVSRKLGEVYLERELPERAAEALEQAEDYLPDRDSPERAHLQMALGRLSKARGDYEDGLSHLRKAVDSYNRYGLTDDARAARHLLVDCAKMLGKADLVLEHMKMLGQSQAGMWRSLIEELEPSVWEAARRGWQTGAYSDSVQAAFRALEATLRQVSGADPDEKISTVARKYLTPERRGLGQFSDPRALEQFREFVVSAFGLIRNPHVHSNREMTAVDAAVALCIVSFAAAQLAGDVASSEALT
jgi:tetratricopeptide (TPR) repeat protein